MFSTRNDTIIDELKAQRKAANASFEELNLIKNEKIAEFFFTKFQTGEDVPFAVLENIPIGEDLLLPVVYGGAIVTTKLEDKSEDIAIYETKWTEGSTLTWHFHSDCTEELVVVEGRVKVYVHGSIHELRTGQKLSVGADIGHQITALKSSTVIIKFNRI